MTVLFQGSPIDIQFDSERNVFDVISGLHSWLAHESLVMDHVMVNGHRVDLTDIQSLTALAISDIRELSFDAAPLPQSIPELLEEMRAYLSKGLYFLLTNPHFSADDLDDLMDGLEVVTEGLSGIMNQLNLNSARVIILTTSAASLVERSKSIANLIEDYIRDEDRLKPIIQSLLIPQIRNMIGALFAISRDAKWSVSLSSGSAIHLEEINLWLSSSLLRFSEYTSEISDAIQMGNDGQAMVRIEILTSFLSRVIELLQMTESHQPPQHLAQIHKMILSFQETLEQVQLAMEQGDYVLLGDLVEYEISDALGALSRSLDPSRLSIEVALN